MSREGFQASDDSSGPLGSNGGPLKVRTPHPAKVTPLSSRRPGAEGCKDLWSIYRDQSLNSLGVWQGPCPRTPCHSHRRTPSSHQECPSDPQDPPNFQGSGPRLVNLPLMTPRFAFHHVIKRKPCCECPGACMVYTYMCTSVCVYICVCVHLCVHCPSRGGGCLRVVCVCLSALSCVSRCM